MKRLAAVLLLSMSPFSSSIAQENCDCSRYVSDCSAEAHLDKERATVDLKTDAKICTKVDFEIDVTRYTSVFSGGTTTEPTMVFQGRPLPVRIRSCNVCVNTDKAAESAAADTAIPKTLADYLHGSWYYGRDGMATMYTFGSDATGWSKHTGQFLAGAGHITCSGEPSHFSCKDEWATTFFDGRPLSWHADDQGSRLDQDTFSLGNDVIFTRR